MAGWIKTVSFKGIDVVSIDVQVHLGNGLPAFTIVGLPDKTVAESRERIRASFAFLNVAFPNKRITVNLAPADLQKEGSHYDLPIALALLCEMGILNQNYFEDYIALGELGLDGTLSKVSGVLAAAMSANQIHHGIICPHICAQEALWANPKNIIAAPDLKSLIQHVKGEIQLEIPTAFDLENTPQTYPDFCEVKGQQTVKRALEIAAVGGHHMMMIGPPGCGKSFLSSCLPGILPDMNAQDALEVSAIYSLAGMSPAHGLIKQRPFRSPHHSASTPALVGGGNKSKPGEISLAHKGVLFMDEFPEFQKTVLESLRQPLENGAITISRAHYHLTYPAQFQLIGAMNPCRCGYFGQKEKMCHRAPQCAQDYQQRISGPLWDRFDMHLYVQALEPEELIQAPTGETSQVIHQRVRKATDFQKEFYVKNNVSYQNNASLKGDALNKLIHFEHSAKNILTNSLERLNLSARGYDRILRLCRSIADLEAQEIIKTYHVSEALSFRSMTWSTEK